MTHRFYPFLRPADPLCLFTFGGTWLLWTVLGTLGCVYGEGPPCTKPRVTRCSVTSLNPYDTPKLSKSLYHCKDRCSNIVWCIRKRTLLNKNKRMLYPWNNLRRHFTPIILPEIPIPYVPYILRIRVSLGVPGVTSIQDSCYWSWDNNQPQTGVWSFVLRPFNPTWRTRPYLQILLKKVLVRGWGV